jgi:hypothetical protein
MNFEVISLQISEHLLGIGQSSLKVLSSLLVALLILLLGLYLSRWVGAFIKKILNKISFDKKTAKLGINELCMRFGLGQSPTYILAFVVAWTVIFYAIVLASEVLHLTAVRDLFTRFLEFIPTLFVSVLILFAGLLLGKLLSNIMENSANANGLKGGSVLASAVYGFMVFFFGLLAVENLGIASQLVNNVALVILSSFGLAFAIAAGLGAKPLMEEFFREIFKKESDK